MGEVLEPLGDRVVVQEEVMPKVSAGGVHIPDVAQDKPQRGIVLAVGPGLFVDGVFAPTGVAVGDRVLYSKYGGTDTGVEGQKVMRLSDLLGVLREGPGESEE